MWNTPIGCRALGKDEGELVGGAAWCLTDDVRTWMQLGDQPGTGILLFDQMTGEQKIVMLDKVLSLLLDPKIKPPPSTALLDATVAAIYVQIRWLIEIEIDMQKDPIDEDDDFTSDRTAVVLALTENPAPDEEPYPDLPDADCTDMDTWELAIESLRDRVLADEDWLMDNLMLDLPPEKSRELKQGLGIRNNYFIDVPPEATIEQARTAWANIVERMSGTRPDESVF
jgi:hypothetical protein